MRKWLILSLLLVSILLPARASAQNALNISTLEVDLWPEYDNPAMLVIYRITLSASNGLPVALTMRIPQAAGKPNAVAARQVDGSLINLVYQQTISGEWSILSFTATTPEVQIEYYDPGLTVQGTARHFEFNWVGDYAVESLAVQVQQPVGATAMHITPNLGSSAPGKDGLGYYNAQVGSLTAGQTFKIIIDYQKNSNALSAESLPVKPSAPLTVRTPGQFMLESWPLILLALGLALIIGGIAWYWRSGRNVPQGQRKRRTRSPAREVRSADTQPVLGDIYCSECGNRANAGDRFCRVCGSALRID
jgi:hypothetical protein